MRNIRESLAKIVGKHDTTHVFNYRKMYIFVSEIVLKCNKMPLLLFYIHKKYLQEDGNLSLLFYKT